MLARAIKLVMAIRISSRPAARENLPASLSLCHGFRKKSQLFMDMFMTFTFPEAKLSSDVAVEKQPFN
jgi:hypothetical protein